MIRLANVAAVWKWWNKPMYMYFLIKRVSPKRFYLSVKLAIKQNFKQKIIMKCLAIKIFAWDFLQTPNRKNIIATLRIVAKEKSELTLLLILYFHATCIKHCNLAKFSGVEIFFGEVKFPHQEIRWNLDILLNVFYLHKHANSLKVEISLKRSNHYRFETLQ